MDIIEERLKLLELKNQELKTLSKLYEISGISSDVEDLVKVRLQVVMSEIQTISEKLNILKNG